MTDAAANEQPGELLESLIWEHQSMEEFKSFVRRRTELERKHVEAMRELRQSAESTFEAIWGLVSPFFNVFDTEIQQRATSSESLLSLLNALPKAASPNEKDEDGNTPTEIYKDLTSAYRLYEECKGDASSLESVTTLAIWNSRDQRSAPLRKMSTADLASYEVPEVDRRYRESVLKQHAVVRTATKWHKEALPARLDAHHDHVEEIKALVNQVTSQYSTQNTAIVRSCSAALKANAAFSTTRFISQSFDSMEEEYSHDHFKSMPYYNFANGGLEATPIFGTGMSLGLAEEILNGPRKQYLRTDFNVTTVLDMLKMEEEWKDEIDLSTKVKLLSGTEANKYLAFAFLSSPPTIRFAERDVKRFVTGQPRKKMEGAYMFIGSKHERLLKQLTSAAGEDEHERAMGTASALLTHRSDCRPILLDIWKNWDFVNQCTLPGSLTRDWSGELVDMKVTPKQGKSSGSGSGSESSTGMSLKRSFMGKRGTF